MALDFPNTPTNGQIYSSGSSAWLFDGTKWNPSGTGFLAFIGDTPPTPPPTPGLLWWNSSPGIGQLYVYYNDGTSSQWVAANNMGGGLYLPLTGGTINPGPLIINANAAAPPAAPAGRNLVEQIVGADAAGAPTLLMDAFGGGVAVISGRAARGTAAAPTATQQSDLLFYLEATGRVSASAYAAGQSAALNFTAAENFTATARGTIGALGVTPRGTTTLVNVINFDADTGVGIMGTSTNNNAVTRFVGEYLAAQVLQASAITLSNGVVANVTSLTLTAGDWDVDGNVHVNSTASAISYAAISLTAATFPDFSARTCYPAMTGDIGGPMVTLRVSTTGTTVYLVVYSAFSSGTTKADGVLRARRVR